MAQLTRGRRVMGEINVVPYIDVMLVLLIIFMVTAPLLTQGVKVDLPKAGAEPIDAKSGEPLVLSIDRAGALYLNVGSQPNQAIDEVTVSARTAAALRREPERAVLVKADTALAYGRVIEAMVLLQQAGATKVGFLTDPLPTNKDSALNRSPGASGGPTTSGRAASSDSRASRGLLAASGTLAR